MQLPPSLSLCPCPHCCDIYVKALRSIHGRVPRHAVRWKTISVVHRERLQDVNYDKAHGEGIAKVSQQCQNSPPESRHAGDIERLNLQRLLLSDLSRDERI